MKRTEHHSEYFCGNKISEYGLQQGYLDYRTLSKAFDAVLCNEITNLFYADINGRYNETEQINGFIDYSEQIDALTETAENSDDTEQIEYINGQIDILREQIDEMQNEMDYPAEIFQYYIVSAYGAEIISEYTNDPVFYLEFLDMYIWGVTHWGTSWDYVLTDVKLVLGDDKQ